MHHLLALDISSAGIPDAAEFLTPAHERRAPKNYSRPEAIEGWQKQDFADELASCGLDLDLARVTGIATCGTDYLQVELCKTEEEERAHLVMLADEIDGKRLVTYNGHAFDLLLVMRRAKYLGVDFPVIGVDRYRSSHADLLQELCYRDNRRMRPLGFYVKRLRWTDLVKPLSGEEESRVPETGCWDELALSLRHDVTAIQRLAQWMGIWPKVSQPVLLERAGGR